MLITLATTKHPVKTMIKDITKENLSFFFEFPFLIILLHINVML